MSKAILENDGCLRLPEGFLGRRDFKLDMVQRVRERGLAVTIGSNGLLLDEAVSRELVQLGVDRLVVSLDDVTPDTYAGVRGATISRVLDNIRSLNKVKSESGSLTPALGIEFVALKSNIGELADLTGLASRLGAARVLVSNVLAYLERFLCGLPVGSGHRWLPLARLYPFAL
jgi:MoaA/NifB/PqqE/SkfB family radical SAM enzyme